jgi:hypothetical protein
LESLSLIKFVLRIKMYEDDKYPWVIFREYDLSGVRDPRLDPIETLDWKPGLAMGMDDSFNGNVPGPLCSPAGKKPSDYLLVIPRAVERMPKAESYAPEKGVIYFSWRKLGTATEGQYWAHSEEHEARIKTGTDELWRVVLAEPAVVLHKPIEVKDKYGSSRYKSNCERVSSLPSPLNPSRIRTAARESVFSYSNEIVLEQLFDEDRTGYASYGSMLRDGRLKVEQRNLVQRALSAASGGFFFRHQIRFKE